MTDSRGYYEKFCIRRVDGTDAPGAKHEHCRYFVLDLDHDPYAKPALGAYMASCAADHPILARDLATLLQACPFGGAPENAAGEDRPGPSFEDGV